MPAGHTPDQNRDRQGAAPAYPSRPSPEAGDREAAAPLAALRLLLPALGEAPAAASARGVHWLVPGGLLIGLIYAALYRSSWRVFGEVEDVRLIPALAVWLVDVTVFGLAMFLGVARTVDRWPGKPPGGLPQAATPASRLGTAGLLALIVVLVVKLVLWTAIPEGISGWPADWRRHFNFMYPRPVFRPLILAPMWGRWGLILAGSIARTAPQEGACLPGLRGARSTLTVMGWFLVNLAITAIYCGRQRRWMIGCIIGLAILGVTYLFCVASARRFSGHTRFTVYAAAFLAEAAFLIFYLAASQRIY